jgi:phosphoglycerol transferase MdoB-like AlkP superfamily enzyme
MTALVWATVISGTFAVYIWYRAAPPEGADLTQYPRSFLLDDPNLSGWHTFGMEWKEHVAWISPIVLTAITYIVWRYGRRLASDRTLRVVVMVLLAVGFVTAAVAGVLGALITKAAPIT